MRVPWMKQLRLSIGKSWTEEILRSARLPIYFLRFLIFMQPLEGWMAKRAIRCPLDETNLRYEPGLNPMSAMQARIFWKGDRVQLVH